MSMYVLLAQIPVPASEFTKYGPAGLIAFLAVCAICYLFVIYTKSVEKLIASITELQGQRVIDAKEYASKLAEMNVHHIRVTVANTDVMKGVLEAIRLLNSGVTTVGDRLGSLEESTVDLEKTVSQHTVADTTAPRGRRNV